MYAGGKLQIVQDDDGIFKLYFVSGDNKCHKIFTMGDAVEALRYLLLDVENMQKNMVNIAMK